MRALLAAGVLMIVTGVPSAQSSPASNPYNALANEPGLIERVHGCHRACVLGGAGWHYHAGPACLRVACGPSPGGPWVWTCRAGRCGWWHPRYRRWH